MSIENGERFIRFLRKDCALRDQVRAAGSTRFEQISAEAGASCRAYDVVAALMREMDAVPPSPTGGR